MKNLFEVMTFPQDDPTGLSAELNKVHATL